MENNDYMNIQLERMLNVENPVEMIDDIDTEKLHLIIETAKAFERNINQSVHIVDFVKCKYLYVSSNINRFCCRNADE